MHSHIFTNKNGNTLMREFEGVLSNSPTIKNLDAVVGFLRASGYFTLRPFLDNINKARVLVGINVDKYIVEAARQGKIFFGAEDEVKEDCLRQVRYDIEHAGYKEEIEQGIFQMVKDRTLPFLPLKFERYDCDINIRLPFRIGKCTTGELHIFHPCCRRCNEL